jgi:glutaminase
MPRQDSNGTHTRDRALFEALLPPGACTVRCDELVGALEGAGLLRDDPRLSGTLQRVGGRDELDFDAFSDAVRHGILTIEPALTGDLVIPEFTAFARELRGIFDASRDNEGGAVADYIPQLARVDPHQFGAAVCTIDGQRASFGESGEPFCLQSACKPISYCIALQERGEEKVHSHVGWEPSGHSFNELTLNHLGLPHNPMINAGGIMSCALIRPDLPVAERFEHVMGVWRELTGGVALGFNNPVYLSERQTADRNFALGHFMREKKAFPREINLVEVLEFYFQCCSMEITCERAAVAAATLAGGGVCPLTGRRVFEPGTVQRCLSLMSSCGMYDFSGEWAFRIGLPAKSGVSGVIMTVVPNVMGLCTWSPRLDSNGNSVRGIDFFTRLVSTFSFHAYDGLVGGERKKKDPCESRARSRRAMTVDLCWAASEGDLLGIRSLASHGADLGAADYDGRTPLHLACAEGRRDVVAFLLERNVDVSPVDRWDRTPLDEAERGGHSEIARLLRRLSS